MANNSVLNGSLSENQVKVSKVHYSSESIQDILGTCKSFFTHDIREKVVKLCELEDLSRSSHIPLMTFSRVLKYLGFRLLFEEIKKFAQLINVYSEPRDRVYYKKIISALLRKLFRPKPYLYFTKPTQIQAVVKIQRFYRAKSYSDMRNPSTLMRELAKRLYELNKPLLRCFEQAEKHRCGYLELPDLEQVFKTHGIEASFEEIKEVFKLVDKRQAGKLNYDNFITAFESFFFALKTEEQPPVSFQVKKILDRLKQMFKGTKLNCFQSFKLFDIGNKGVVAFDEFFEVLARVGFKYCQSELRQVFDYVDTGKDKYWSFIEFASAFYDLNESPIEILRRLEIEEQIRKEEEAKRLAEEERLRLIQEEEDKKRLEEEEKKKAEESKGKKKGKSKAGAKSGKGKSAGSAKAGKKAGKGSKSGKAKTGKKGAVEPIPEPVIDENEIRLQELREFMRKEYIEPIISIAYVQSDYMQLAKAGQTKLENRPVDKYIFTYQEDWTQVITNPMVQTLWSSGKLGQTGYLDDSGILKTHNLSNGQEIDVLHLGTKPPFEKIPILGGACDSRLGRIYVLNKQWVLEIWNLHEKSAAPIKRVKVLSKIVGCDYVQKYDIKNFKASPNLLALANDGEIIVNSTCADGFVYCFEPISLTLLWRARLTLDEIRLSKAELGVYDDFDLFIRHSIKNGITEEKLYEILNPNSNGKITFNEFMSVLHRHKLTIKEQVLKNIFKVFDSKNLGYLYLDRLFSGKFLRNLEFIKTDLDSSKLLPDWVNNLHANQSVKDAMYRIYSILETKNISSSEVIAKLKALPDFLPDDEYVPNDHFHKTLTFFLSPQIKAADLDLVIKAEDRQNSGKINFNDFFRNLSSKKLSPTALLQLNSQSLPRDSLKYILHKSIELGVDLYKKCKDLDPSASGTLPKEVFASILLLMPIGLDTETLDLIFDRDLTFNSIGNIDYLEIFERQEYFQLVISSNKSDFLTPPIQEEAAVLQDFAFIQELSLIAFTSINPTTSTVFLKDLNGSLIAKLVGHLSYQPPVLYYCSRSNTLISGETRVNNLYKSDFDVVLPPAGILLWNIQQDLVDKYRLNPPWVLRPYRKVLAHEGSIRTLGYLPFTQVIISSGSDKKVKIWNTTGLPFTLTEQEHIPISEKLMSQHTESNQMMACVGSFDCDCQQISVTVNGNREWALLISGQNEETCIKSYSFGRFKLVLTAKQHDWEVPKYLMEKIQEYFKQDRDKRLEGFSGYAEEKRKEVEKMVELTREYEKKVQKTVVNAIIYEEGFEDIVNVVEKYPGRKEKTQVSPAEIYNVLVKYAGFYSITFSKFLFILNDVQEKRFGRKITNKDEAAIVSLVRGLEESKSQEVSDEDIEMYRNGIFKCICKCLETGKKSAFEILAKLDLNQDKVLNVDEFSDFFKKIGLNLRKSEVVSIINCLDPNNTTTVNTQIFHKKLEETGYSDPFYTNCYDYVWQDSATLNFIRAFRSQHKFRNFFELFSYFDNNMDGFLTPSELLEGLSSVYKKESERIANVFIASLKNSLNCRVLGDVFENASKAYRELNQTETNYESMQVSVSKYNSLEEIHNSVDGLMTISQNVLKNLSTGIEIHARKYRLRQGLKLINTGKILFQESIDRVLSAALTKLHLKILHDFPKAQVFSSGFALEDQEVTEYSTDDFQIVWDNDESVREGEGKIIESNESIMAVGFSQDLLKIEIPEQGTFQDVLNKEIKTNLKLQKISENIVKVLGTCQAENEFWVIYEKPENANLKQTIDKNGGILQIPITSKISAGKIIASYWGKEILKILQFLETNSVVMPYFSPQVLYFNQDYSGFKVRLQWLGYVDSAGKVSKTDFFSLIFQEFENSFENHLSPEFCTSQSQSLNCQVWNFGLILFTLSFGESFSSYKEYFKKKSLEKSVKNELKVGVKPNRTFIFSPVSYFEVCGGKVLKNSLYEIGLLKALASQSFSGLVSDFSSENTECLRVEDLKKQVKLRKDAEIKREGLGDVFDIISICLIQDDIIRPNLQSIIDSKFFNLNEQQEKQAKIFGKIVFSHKNPDLVISQFVTQKLVNFDRKFSVDLADEVNELILNLSLTLLSYDDQVLKDTIDAIYNFDVPENEKKEMIDKNLVFPTTELLNKCFEDQVFARICRLALLFAYKGEFKVIESFASLLKSLIEYVNSVKVPILKHSYLLIKIFIQLFIGKGSISQSFSHILEQSYWKPEIYYILRPIYNELFNELGEANEKFPGLKSLINTIFHPSYISELGQIFENLSVLKNDESLLAEKQSALKSLRDVLKSNNEYKIKAARDSKFVQFIINFLQDEEIKLRYEVLEIFSEISQSAKEKFLYEIGDISQDVDNENLINFLVLSGQVVDESRSNTSSTHITQYMKQISKCFESALFIYPVVRLLKLKSETAENKETALKLLVNILQGEENSQFACVSPFTDSLSTICLTLTSFFKSTDQKTGKNIGDAMQKSVEEFLSTASPMMLKAFRLAPGADIVLKDQNLAIPDSITIAQLVQKSKNPFSINDIITPYLNDFRNYLRCLNEVNEETIEGVYKSFSFLQNTANIFWVFVENTVGAGKAPLSSDMKKHCRLNLKEILSFFEYSLLWNLDHRWLEEIDNIEWIIEKSLKAIEHSGSDYNPFPFEAEGKVCLRILCRLMKRPKIDEVLEKLVFGKVFVLYFKTQVGQLKEQMLKNLSSLEILEYNRELSQIRKKIFSNLLKFPKLVAQAVESGFCEYVVRDYLSDKKMISVEENDFVYEFISLKQMFPVRCEAMDIVLKIFKKKKENEEIFKNLIELMKTHRAVINEIKNIQDSNQVLSLASIELLHDLIRLAENDVSELLAQADAAKSLKAVLAKTPKLREKFLGLFEYSARLN